jgi:TetR/AcrR family tetracycline transcriptional repressor
VTTTSQAPARRNQHETQRTPLSRERIVRTALEYIDGHGLAAMSMHKLGSELGVKGMSLYNHVANKDDVLDGVVELLWTEVEQSAPPRTDWVQGVRSFAHATREMIRRHANAAPLITSQSFMPQPALRIVKSHATAIARGGGVRDDEAYALLRTVTSYALGCAYNEVSWGQGDPACAPAVPDLLRPGTPDDLAAVANVFCGQYDLDAQFELGLDLMLRGIEAGTCESTHWAHER